MLMNGHAMECSSGNLSSHNPRLVMFIYGNANLFLNRRLKRTSADQTTIMKHKYVYLQMNGLWFCQEKGCSTKSPFDCEYALRMHFYDTHLREEEKIFVCEYCNQHFALRTLLNKHVDAAHLKRFQCDWCGK